MEEAKRQKSEPTTPICTSSRHPSEYDEVMGITQVDPRGAERFEEGLDSEYHDAAEEPADTSNPEQEHGSGFSHGGCGSSSLRECLNLLDHTRSNFPAPCHSRVTTEKTFVPLQVMSPNVEEEQTHATGLASGSVSEGQLLPKDKPQSRRKEDIKEEQVTPKILRLESMVCGEHGETIGEAIRACNRRLDNHRATMDDFLCKTMKLISATPFSL